MQTPEEWDPPVFLRAIRLAKTASDENAWHGSRIYHHDWDEEFPITTLDDVVVSYAHGNGSVGRVPTDKLSNWSFIVPEGCRLRAYFEEASAPDRRRTSLVEKLRSVGLPVSLLLSEDDIKRIEQAYATNYEQTTGDFRRACYAAIKKMENFPTEQQNSFRCGRVIVEKWKSECLGPEPGDLLIHLAYYRRWTRDTLAALEASDCLNGPSYRSDLKDGDRSVLATERAAALMDLYEKGQGSLGEVVRYLKLSYATNGGSNSEHNANTWGRFERLVGRR